MVEFDFDRQIGQRIRILRKTQGLSQEQLSAKLQTYGCDITRSGLAKIEAGQRHIYAHEIRAIKAILRVPYDVLFE